MELLRRGRSDVVVSAVMPRAMGMEIQLESFVKRLELLKMAEVKESAPGKVYV